jgi:hypothetical protein
VHYSKDQVKKKIENLKKNWKEFTDLLTGHIATGVGWNEVDNTIALDERQWQQLKSVSISLSFVVSKYKLVKLYSSSNTFMLCCGNTIQVNITDSGTAPANYSLLNSVFGGSSATGQYRHASTRSPPESSDSDDIVCVDLNLSPAIIDLTDP